MDIRHRVTRSQGILVSAQLVRLALFALITTFLGRRLAPAEFGFVALVSTLFLVAQEILDMGTSSVVTRQIVQEPATERQALRTLLTWRRRVALIPAALALALAIGGFATTTGQQAVLVVAAIALPFLSLNAYHVVFQVRQAFGRAVALGLGAQLLFLLSGAAVLHGSAGGSLWGLASGSIIGLLVVARELAQVLGSRLVATRMLGGPLHAGWLDAGIKPLLRRSGAFGIAALCYKLSALSGSFFIWMWSTPEALGQFNAAHRLLGPFTDTAWLFATPLIASMSLSAKSRPWALRLQLGSLAQLLISLSCTIAVSGQFVAPMVLRLLYGEAYQEGRFSAVGILQWLSLAGAFALVTPLLSVACLAQGRERLLLLVSLSGLAFGVVANSIVIPMKGPLGAAIVMCASEAWVMLALFADALWRHELRLRADWLIALAPAALLFFALPPLSPHPAAQLLACVSVVPLGLLALRRLPQQRAARTALAHPSPGAPG